MPKPVSLAKLRLADRILFEDDELLALDKPAGVSSLQERHATEGSTLSAGLLSLLKEDLGNQYPELHLCHRLDKYTSGVLLFAKTDEAYRSVSMQFQEREVMKLYWALVPGAVHWTEELVELPLKEARGGKVIIAMDGKPAATAFQTVSVFKHYTLMAAIPMTGRQHQIRVHLAARRLPIVGDTLYGGEDFLLSKLKRRYRPPLMEEERPLNDGYLLHARQLQLHHPTTGVELTVEAPLPKNFRVVLEVLEKYDSV